MASTTDAPPLMLALRGTQGVQLQYGPPNNQPVEFFTSVKVDSRFMVFSPHGRYLVYHTPTGVQLIDIQNQETLELGEGTVLVRDAAFSPQEGYLVLWDAPSKKEDNSCTVYDLKSRTVKAVYSQLETTWKITWSSDDKLLFLMGKDQTYVFGDPDFSTPVCVPKNNKIGEISISPVSKPYHVIVFNPYKSTPGFVRLYRYPSIDDPATALAARSVMKEDQVVFKWNAQGTHVLFLAATDVDEKSYYGSSQLFLMNTSSDSLVISLDQEGPVHAWEWNPNGESFCVIYGYMPGKTCIFNKRGDRVHTFGASQYRNGLMYNPFGNLLVLYGHGNIRGALEVWDMTHMKKVCSHDAEYMTYIEWAPDGATFLVATTSPRLKVGNKHQVWSYTGQLLLDQPYAGELFQVCWRRAPPGMYKPPDPSVELGKNFTPNEQKKAAAYIPPSMRNRVGIVGLEPEAGASVHYAAQVQSSPGFGQGYKAGIPGLTMDEDAKKKAKRKKKPKTESEGEKREGDEGTENTGVPRSAPQNIRADHAGYGHRRPSDSHFGSGSPSSYGSYPSRYPRYPPGPPRRPSLKTEGSHSTHLRTGNSESQGERRPSQPDTEKRTPKPKPNKNAPRPVAASPERLAESDGDENQMVSSGDPERDKKIARLNKKLAEINVLKQEQASGKVMEKNQLDKIKRLDSIVKDLEKLQLSTILKKK
ncbi:eukaryotic translation initiation factor 2A-like [Paramacrobiotus metropolitanus]|uniref:eukaryotic translation initiation factor 2A-like n=1 Tax=Paramacrobiotus metropolitanus TaxID=2943436 RepID=UPI002446292A|nr:eukaryotic translation initiation factor 2A-like [Paramacrobiotus metropolitanus]